MRSNHLVRASKQSVSFANGIPPGLRSMEILLPSNVAHWSQQLQRSNRTAGVGSLRRHLDALRQHQNNNTSNKRERPSDSVLVAPTGGSRHQAKRDYDDDSSLTQDGDEDDGVIMMLHSRSTIGESAHSGATATLLDRTGIAYLQNHSLPKRTVSEQKGLTSPEVSHSQSTSHDDASVRSSTTALASRVLATLRTSPHGVLQTARLIRSALHIDSREPFPIMNPEIGQELLLQICQSLFEAQKRSVSAFTGHFGTVDWTSAMQQRRRSTTDVGGDATSYWRQRIVSLVMAGYEVCHQLLTDENVGRHCVDRLTPLVAREVLRFCALTGDSAMAQAVLERLGPEVVTAQDCGLAKAACCYSHSFSQCEAIHHQFEAQLRSESSVSPHAVDIAHLTVLANCVGQNSVDCVRLIDEFQRCLRETAAGATVPAPQIAVCTAACLMAIAAAIPMSEREPLAASLYHTLVNCAPAAVLEQECVAEAMLFVLSSVGSFVKTPFLRSQLRSRPLSTYAAVCLAAEPPVEQLVDLFRDTRQVYHGTMATAASVRLVAAVHEGKRGALADQFSLWSLQGPSDRIVAEGLLTNVLTSLALHLDRQSVVSGEEVTAAMEESLRMVQEYQQWYHTRTVSLSSVSALIRLRVLGHLTEGVSETLRRSFDTMLVEVSEMRFAQSPLSPSVKDMVVTSSQLSSLFTSNSSSGGRTVVIMLEDESLVAIAEYVATGGRDCALVEEALNSLSASVREAMSLTASEGGEAPRVVVTVDQLAMLRHATESLLAVKHRAAKSVHAVLQEWNALIADGAASALLRTKQHQAEPQCIKEAVVVRLPPAIRSVHWSPERQAIEGGSGSVPPAMLCSPRHLFQPKTALECATPWLLSTSLPRGSSSQSSSISLDSMFASFV